MAKDFAKPFYNSKKWQACRQSYIDKRFAVGGGVCELCREQPGYIVHHKVWLDENNITDPMVTLNHDNLQYVCLDCHNRIEREEKNGERRYRIGPNGEVLPP